MDIKYESNGTVYSNTIGSLNIASGASYAFIHNTPLMVNNPAPYPLKVWVDVAGDADHTDDTLNTLVTGLSFQTTKRVLIEEGTGTWCGWCPRGAVYTEQIDTVFPGTALVVAVHNSDPMENTAYDAGMGTLISGYPGGAVDRKDVDVDPTDFGASYSERINDVSPADVGVSAYFNAATRQVDVVVSSTFAADLSGNFRLGAILVEDEVTGTTAAYSQANYYSFQTNNIPLVGAGHNWQTDPDPVPFANMVYQFVGREILGGYTGQAGSVPASVSANSTYSYTFSTTIPLTWDENEMRVIGILLDASTGHVLNANRGAYGITTTVAEVKADNFSLALYPNPADQFAQLEVNLKNSTAYTVDIVDVLGKSFFSQQFTGAAGKNVLSLPVGELRAGIYLVRVNVDGSVISNRLVIE
ncbi:MAG: Omp28-related outer membrane protein [Bacteroidia bacterium]|nr:Omp28-related outer membrane protein [Bacteroidia bacterium]